MLRLEDREWREFVIKDLFSCSRGQRQVAQNRIEGKIAYYSASDINNGLSDCLSNPSFTEKENSIVCSTFGQAYFANGNFSASDEITILKNKHIKKSYG